MSSKLILEETPNTNSAISELVSALQGYTHALTTLEDTSSPSKETVLEVLTARDTVQAELTNQSQIPTGSLIKVNDLDHRLKQETNKITTVDLTELHSILNPNVDAWWWFLEPPKHRWDYLDWLWKILTVVFITLSLSLTVDIASRFLSGGPDSLGAFVAATQSVLTIFAGRTAFTKTGQESIKRALTRLKIPHYFWEEVSCGIAFSLLLISVTVRLLLPQIAIVYENIGDGYNNNNKNTPEFAAAISSNERALLLNPDYVEPHYNLGELYEKLQDKEKALDEYQIAVEDDFDRAYNKLGRMYIIDEKYYKASSLLLRGIELNTDSENDTDNTVTPVISKLLKKLGLNSIKQNTSTDDEKVKYNLRKNLGWARLKQERYAEAKRYIKDAIKLDNKKAPAYCLLAKVLQAEKNKAYQKNTEKRITKNWIYCLAYASSYNIDEDQWIEEARQHLETPLNLGNNQVIPDELHLETVEIGTVEKAEGVGESILLRGKSDPIAVSKDEPLYSGDLLRIDKGVDVVINCDYNNNKKNHKWHIPEGIWVGVNNGCRQPKSIE
ncbi:tetratricopeptide repeat protein [Moorena sp. SIO3H5]|uniref:tetratricopeptide repeat protein n=1 Tax=Moorena sp. SIO3H5 TaxID=2607834 RepID=UPI0025F87581|nr:tetratricopeptide repeat protein [Moorena sp. SIO3H5]